MGNPGNSVIREVTLSEISEEQPDEYPGNDVQMPREHATQRGDVGTADSTASTPEEQQAVTESRRPAVRVRSREDFLRAQRRHRRTCGILFFATLLSTFMVGSGYAPVEYFVVESSLELQHDIQRRILQEAFRTDTAPISIGQYLETRCYEGLRYSIPLMFILLCHEMGHYLVALRNRVPASLPYFIPLPLPPLGTMGAVILQGRGVANRRQMFDIAVCGPLAGLFATIPILMYGIQTSEFREIVPTLGSMDLGEPLILQWMIAWFHGPVPAGSDFALNGYAMAGWVGVFVTALNLIPVGQLDGGHILYTLVGKRAHFVAWFVIIGGSVAMWLSGTMSYILILILLLLTGVKHPPTADDATSLGWFRQCVGWTTLAFLIIGFTPQPIMISQPQAAPPAARQPKPDGSHFASFSCGRGSLSPEKPATSSLRQPHRDCLQSKASAVEPTAPSRCHVARIVRHGLHQCCVGQDGTGTAAGNPVPGLGTASVLVCRRELFSWNAVE
jgi:Zn-dependent protease